MTPVPLKSLELFVGAGGLALGLSKAHVDHSAIIEWNRYACETIRANKRDRVHAVKDWPDPIQCDVRDVNFAEFGPVDIVSGGVPCQPFSMGGLHQAYLDPRDMFPQAIRAVHEIRPKAFLWENVRGLVRPSFANYFEYIRLRLEYPSLIARKNEEWEKHLARLERHRTSGGKVEYRVVARVLDAANFGVPQRRHRVFLVGIREDLNREFSFPDETHSYDRLLFDQFVSRTYWERHRIAKKKWPSASAEQQARLNGLRDLFDESTRAPWKTVRDTIFDLPKPATTRRARVQAHVFQPGARSYPGHTGSPLDEPSKALKSGVHGVPGGENAVRGEDGAIRYFTVRESARIQCFPDEFAFSGSWSEAMRQLGNAVPVDLAAAVATRLASVLR